MKVGELKKILKDLPSDFRIEFIQSHEYRPVDKWINREEMDMPVFKCEANGEVCLETQRDEDPYPSTIKDFNEEFLDCSDDSEISIYNEYGNKWTNIGWNIGYMDHSVLISGNVI